MIPVVILKFDILWLQFIELNCNNLDNHFQFGLFDFLDLLNIVIISLITSFMPIKVASDVLRNCLISQSTLFDLRPNMFLLIFDHSEAMVFCLSFPGCEVF